jgi:hypothetical protein
MDTMKTNTKQPKRPAGGHSVMRLVRWFWIWERSADTIPENELLCINGVLRYLIWPLCLFIGLHALIFLFT